VLNAYLLYRKIFAFAHVWHCECSKAIRSPSARKTIAKETLEFAR
jgi:hypothetical protein